ncbi:MAG: tetratricopeptide repeat protein [bacterium]
MAGLFMMAALLCWLRGSAISEGDGPRHRRVLLYTLFLLFALAGCLCKENTVSLALLVPVLDLVLSGKGTGCWLWDRWKVPVAGVLALTAAALFYAPLGPGFLQGYELRDFTLWERLLTQPRVVLWYITIWEYPATHLLSLEHHVPVSSGIFSPPSTALALAALLVITIASICYVKKEPLICGGWLWFVAGLLIESSFLPLEIAFEHRLYVPGLGLFLVAAGLFARLEIKRSAVPFLVLVLVSFSVLSFARNRVWQSKEKLWKDAVQKAPERSRPFANLCAAKYRQNELKKARRWCRAALSRRPDNGRALLTLGLVYRVSGELDTAKEVMERALEVRPSEGLIHY